MGDGFYEPGRNLVYSYNSERVLRKVDKEEAEVIKAKYRYEPRVRDINGSDDITITGILSSQDNPVNNN